MPVSPYARLTRGLLAVLAGAILAFLYLPIAFLILFSFEKADTPGFPITGLTLHWYEVMLADSADPLGAAQLGARWRSSWRSWRRSSGRWPRSPLVRGGIRFAGTGPARCSPCRS